MSLTVRLPKTLVAELRREARQRGVSVSDVVRSRLSAPAARGAASSAYDLIHDLIGTIEGLPPDLSSRRKHYLAKSGYGKPRS
jgi:hypothetical protein